MVLVDTARCAATSLTLSSVRNLSAESSGNDAKTCDSLEFEPGSSRVLASGCEAQLFPGCASSGLRSRGPQDRLLPGAPSNASVSGTDPGDGGRRPDARDGLDRSSAVLSGADACQRRRASWLRRCPSSVSMSCSSR